MKDIQASLKGIGDDVEGGAGEEHQTTNELTDEESDSDEDEDLGGYYAMTGRVWVASTVTSTIIIDTTTNHSCSPYVSSHLLTIW